MNETDISKGKENSFIKNSGLCLELLAEDIVETVREPLLVLASDLRVIFANHSFYTSFHTNREETEDRFLFDLGNGQWHIPQLQKLLDEVFTQNTVFKNFAVEHEFKSMGKRIMYINARRLDRKKDPKKFILLAIEDVTERIYLERNLREYKTHLEELTQYRTKMLTETHGKLVAEKERLKVTLQSIGDAVVTTDIHGRITLVNPAAENLTGWSQARAVGKPLSTILKILDGKNRTPIPDIAETIIAAKTSINLGQNLILVSPDGHERRIDDTGSPLWDPQGKITGMVLVFRDITEQKIMEDKLRQSHKMESIGTLAGGIAHDFNNILFAIMGYTDLAMLTQTQASKARPYLKGIHTACNRAKDLVHQILTFSHQAKQVFTPVQVSSVIEEAIKLIRASLPATIHIETNINSDSKIVGDATQIYQVIYNLCTNAAQAIQDGMGKIQINVADTKIQDELSRIHPELRPGNYVKVSVVDSGHGISSRVKHKIFDPYYTTKQLGKGTGLGLAVVHGIITNHDGAISVFSEPGKGATFDVYFPVIERREDKAAPTKSFEPLETGDETILLVEDEAQILQMEGQILEKLGYRVTAMSNGRSALETFAKTPDKFDLVITDMTMPGMTGYQLAKKIKKLRPHTPIILCSGYTHHISEKKTKAGGISAFVLKPINMMDLSKITRKILDHKPYERRQNERFKIKEKAVVIAKSDPVKEFEIADISWGGMAIFSHAEPGSENKFNELAISMVDKGILLDKVPCKVISDVRLSALFLDIEKTKKRQGIQFGKMAYNQLNILDHLIHSYTIGGA